MDQLNNKTHENWYSMNITEFVHLHVYKSSLNIVHLIYTPFYVHKHVYHTYQSIHTFRLLFFIHVHVNIQTIYTASIIMYVRHTCIHITSVRHTYIHITSVCHTYIHIMYNIAYFGFISIKYIQCDKTTVAPKTHQNTYCAHEYISS